MKCETANKLCLCKVVKGAFAAGLVIESWNTSLY